MTATEGATALNLNNLVEENKIFQNKSIVEQNKDAILKEKLNEGEFENISIENASYLQNLENRDIQQDSDIPNFEIDSIELATPELFSKDFEDQSFNQENNQEEPKIFENSNNEKDEEIKEPEMFEESTMEEDFEIPAFLRRQKN